MAREVSWRSHIIKKKIKFFICLSYPPMRENKKGDYWGFAKGRIENGENEKELPSEKSAEEPA